MVICYAACFAYPGVRVCLPVSLSVYHPRWACIRGCLYCRPVNVYSIMRYTRRTWLAGIINFINSNRVVCNLLNICRARACCISFLAMYIGVINYGCVMYNVYHPAMWCIIIVYLRVVHVTLRRANPVIIGRSITTTY